MTAACPQCRRPVATAQPRCLYCGADLPAEAVAAAAAARTALEAQPPLRAAGDDAGPRPAEGRDPSSSPRALVVLDLRRGDPGALAGALGLSAYEAAQRIRRGGDQLLRVADAGEALREAEILAGQGLEVVVIPEEEVRGAVPIVVTRGGPEQDGLVLRAEHETVHVTAKDVLLVVKGPIAREYQAEGAGGKRPRGTGLDPGHRFHLHRRSHPRPIELDPGGFDFGADSGVISSILEITSWIAHTFPESPVDDGFRLLAPALSLATAGSGSAAAADGISSVLAASRPGRTLLDNVGQFRFYSGWHAAVERRRRS